MKTLKTICLFAIVLFSLQANAADLAVAQNGTGGAYASITDAYNAATNGDRIIITPQSGNSPYVENLTISKSLQFISGVEGQQFTIQGTITINAAAGREVTFIGMRNLVGNISGNTTSPVGTRCKVNIVNCTFLNGNVAFDYDNWDINLISSEIKGTVTYRYGKVIGNIIDCDSLPYTPVITVNTDANPSNDTLLIIGNKIYVGTDFYCCYTSAGIYWTSSSQYFSFMNNYITHIPSYGSTAHGIYVSNAKSSSTGTNTIVNNTITSLNTIGITYGIYTPSVTNALYVIKNNVLKAPTFSNPLYGFGGVSFNYTNTGNLGGSLINDGTNNLTATINLDADGRLLAGSDPINAGDADSSYYDINLTRNDAGAYGGSFTLDNFHPFYTGAARVYFLNAPRRVTIGNTIGIKADSFDR
ncbi:MAG: hypothetical protein SFW35_10700 [Chitinophagales bacterium]|nr:hypothetical protein [Chitinophagales bacterium]